MRQRTPREFLKVRVDPTLRRAIKLRAALQDSDLQDVIVVVLGEGLKAEIEVVQKRGLVTEEATPAAGAKKGGRRQKDDE